MTMGKPLAVRLGEGRDLVDAGKGHHVQIGYAENHALAPLTIKAMQHVQAGDIGKLHEIRCVFAHGGPLEGAWQWDMATAGGGRRAAGSGLARGGCLSCTWQASRASRR